MANSNYVYPVTNYTNSSTTITFSVNLGSGKYGFRLYDDVYGYYRCVSTLTVSADLTNYTVANSSVSFNGDTVTIQGANIGLGSVIKVNGLIG